MASPFGHSVLGLSVAELATGKRPLRSWPWYLYIIFAANAPDLDFVPGFFIGDMNRYHHTGSHSIFAAFLFGWVAGLIVWRFARHPAAIGVIGGLVYTAHLVGDYFAHDLEAPFGIAVFWPFTNTFYIAPSPFISNITHGDFGQDNISVISDIFSLHNLMAVGLEAIMFVPLLLVCVWIARKRNS